MDEELLLSLCIPTNGICEWVKPVLESIYAEKNPIGRFEVIVTDNGNNHDFYEMMMKCSSEYDNLLYKRTNAVQFVNQIEAFKLAKGKMIKFINHRMVFLPGALNYLLQFVLDHEIEKPCVYFMNNGSTRVYYDFEQYVKGLSYWSSYSGGTAIWKTDFDEIDLSKGYSELFPHTIFVLRKSDSNKYIIDGHKIVKSLPTDERKKGRYNLFYAFAVEYPSILLTLYRNKSISIETFNSVNNDLCGFIAELYLKYVIFRRPCSYDLSDTKKNIIVFFSVIELYLRIPVIIFNKIIRIIKGRLSYARKKT